VCRAITQNVITLINRKNLAPAVKNIITMIETVIYCTDGWHEYIMNIDSTTHTIETTVWYENIMNALSALTVIKYIITLDA
jgi:hypothetical protein